MANLRALVFLAATSAACSSSVIPGHADAGGGAVADGAPAPAVDAAAADAGKPAADAAKPAADAAKPAADAPAAPPADAAAIVDVAPPYDVNIPASGPGVIHASPYAVWKIYDVASYRAHQANMEEVMGILDRAIPAIQARMQQPFDFPIKVTIEKGGCCGAFTAGGEVGYDDEDFSDGFGMYWIRGVIIGEVVNAVVGSVSENWPSDWWVNSVWYFPGFAVVDVMKEVAPDHWQEWQQKEKYDQFPVSVLFDQLRVEHGWKIYQDLFTTMRADQIDLGKVGSNPSAIITNYVLAYFGVAAGENIADRFVAAQVPGADPTTVQAIMDARAKLVAAAAAGTSTTAAWRAFRSGDYQGAAQGL